MKKRSILVIVTLAAFHFSTQAAMAAAYDSTQTKAAMQQVLQNFKELNARVTVKDYYGAAERFMDLAKIYKALENVTPPTGDQVQWIRIKEGMVNSAFKGIGACGLKDDAGIQRAIGDIIKLRDEGHQMFMLKK